MQPLPNVPCCLAAAKGLRMAVVAASGISHLSASSMRRRSGRVSAVGKSTAARRSLCQAPASRWQPLQCGCGRYAGRGGEQAAGPGAPLPRWGGRCACLPALLACHAGQRAVPRAVPTLGPHAAPAHALTHAVSLIQQLRCDAPLQPRVLLQAQEQRLDHGLGHPDETGGRGGECQHAPAQRLLGGQFQA